MLSRRPGAGVPEGLQRLVHGRKLGGKLLAPGPLALDHGGRGLVRKSRGGELGVHRLDPGQELGALGREALALPALVGVAAGVAVFNRIDAVRFRQIVFTVLFVSGVVLLVRG